MSETKDNSESVFVKPDNSDYAVAVRREWLSEQYLSGVPSAVIFQQYNHKFGMSKYSFDKDLTVVRKDISINLVDKYEQVINDQLNVFYSIQNAALATGDTNTALRAGKSITDLMKLVNPNKKGDKVKYNQTNNIKLPAMSVDQIKELLGMNTVIDITPKVE